jgi:Glycosyl transferase family 2
MPAVSLVICLYRERDLLARLLSQADNCYDDLVVVHDGKDTSNVRSLVESASGCFFEQPREFQQEPHWPFAWEQARHDWILRLDADEIPSEGMKRWLKQFRRSGEPPGSISGYTCIWPLWDGKRIVSKKWPADRRFLFHRQRVRFFGMVEQVPVPDGRLLAEELVLIHQPLRKSYGFKNLLCRRQAYHWRERIASSLLHNPSDLPCWRWDNKPWPPRWEQIRRRPLSTAISRLSIESLRTLRNQWRTERKLYPVAAISGPIHHALICLKYWQLRRKKMKP